MIPGPALSVIPYPSIYLSPDNIPPDYTVDYELGGVDIQDASQGLMVKTWTARLLIDPETLIGTVTIEAADRDPVVLFTRPNVTEISIAFDQNMNPFVAFMQAGVASYWWYDSSSEAQIFSTLPVGTTAPKCCMDDKRISQVTSSDIILAYVRAGTLYFRAQRDRYLIEYTLKTGVTGSMLEVGMTQNNRLQFLLGTFG